MTDPVILLGTQSNGETLPVQVDEFGRLVAEGLKGDPGDPGNDGDSATVDAGTTTTGEPGTNAQVSNSGSTQNAVFDFVIPRGAKGDPGDPGPAGEDGTDGIGVPTPYGDEGSYLWIKDGQPAWTTGSDPGPEPEPPDPQKELVFLPYATPSSTSWRQNNAISNAGTDLTLVQDWDDHIRALDCWEQPNRTNYTGVGQDAFWTAEFKFELKVVAGMVLTIWTGHRGRTAAADPNTPGRLWYDSSSSYLQGIRTEFQTGTAIGGIQYVNGAPSWYMTRDNFEVYIRQNWEVTFLIDSGYSCLYKFLVEPPAKWMQRNYDTITREEINRLKALMRSN